MIRFQKTVFRMDRVIGSTLTIRQEGPPIKSKNHYLAATIANHTEPG